MSATEDFADVEMLAILSAIAIAGYIGYSIYSNYEATTQGISDAAGAVGSSFTDALMSGQIL